MALTKLDERIVRRIDLGDGRRPLVVEIDAEGVTLRGLLTAKVLGTTWERIAEAADAPSRMPIGYVGRKLDWLTEIESPE